MGENWGAINKRSHEVPLGQARLSEWRASKQLLRPDYAVAKPSEMAKPSGTPKSVIVTLLAVETRMLRASRS